MMAVYLLDVLVGFVLQIIISIIITVISFSIFPIMHRPSLFMDPCQVRTHMACLDACNV